MFQVKFDFDAIDETDLLEETLKPRVESFGGKLEKVILGGNHITPCAQVVFFITDVFKIRKKGEIKFGNSHLKCQVDIEAISLI